MPCIYYGDEIGSEGFEDPFCRAYFDWDKTENNFLLDFYRQMASLKNNSEVLKYGNVEIKYIRKGVISVIRRFDEKLFTLTSNLSDEVYFSDVPENILLINKCELSSEKIYAEKFGFFCSID